MANSSSSRGAKKGMKFLSLTRDTLIASPPRPEHVLKLFILNAASGDVPEPVASPENAERGIRPGTSGKGTLK